MQGGDETSIARSFGADATRDDVRRILLHERAMLGDAWRRRADEAINRALCALLAPTSSRPATQVGSDACAAASGTVVGAYWPMRGEPDVRASLIALHERGVVVALPAVPGSPGPLRFGRWRPGGVMRRALFGTAEPHPFEPVEPLILLIPCVGFDAACHRLGYGGGYYDRTLAARPGTAIGVAYGFAQLADFVPAAHDRPLSAVVTERAILRPAPLPSDARRAR